MRPILSLIHFCQTLLMFYIGMLWTSITGIDLSFRILCINLNVSFTLNHSHNSVSLMCKHREKTLQFHLYNIWLAMHIFLGNFKAYLDFDIKITIMVKNVYMPLGFLYTQKSCEKYTLVVSLSHLAKEISYFAKWQCQLSWILPIGNGQIVLLTMQPIPWFKKTYILKWLLNFVRNLVHPMPISCYFKIAEGDHASWILTSRWPP